MTTPFGGIRFHLGLIIATLACLFGGRASALTVTATTSDNGYPAHLVSWTDASGNPRSAMMVDQNSNTTGGPYTGYLRQYTYQVGGSPRVCTGQYSYSTGGNLEFSGDGFVQNHGAYGADSSTGNGVGFAGTTTISPTNGDGSTHVVTITYSIPGYTVYDLNGNTQTVPTTVQWFFADGKNDPVFSVSQDASGTPGALGLDSRTPYGDMEYDGVLPATPGATVYGNNVGGFSYGDQYKFITTASNPEQVTPASPWTATQTNTIPYAMQWTEPSAADAEFGHVATVPLSVRDAGSDSQTSAYYNLPSSPNQTLYFDPRNQTSNNSATNGSLPPWNTMAYQIVNASGDMSSDVGLITNPLGLAASLEPNPNGPGMVEVEPNDAAANPPVNPQPTQSKKVTWQTNFGFVGGFNFYYQYNDSAFNYSTHSGDINSTGSPAPVLASGQGARASGALAAYSTFVVLGLHSTGTVAGVVTQVENAALATFSASTGTVATSGPSGVGRASITSVTYVPAGYNPIYSTWELTASGNAVSATLTPANGKSLANPVFLIDNYTSSQLPGSISINGHSVAGTDYYATVDTANQRLWITANSTASSAMTLAVTAPAATDLFGGVSQGGTLKYSSWFGYYDTADYPLVYEYYLGYEYAYDAGGGGVYLYDYPTGHFFYTQASYFPFVYDFSLNAFLYYYNVNTPHRHFYSYGTNTVITQ